MKILSRLSFFIIFSLLIISSTPVSAVTISLPTELNSKQNLVISDVNIRGPKIISQSINKINLSFSISNGNGAQSGISYGVKLIKESKGGQFVADEYIFPESLNLNPNTTIKKEVVYNTPVNLNGEYSLLVIAKNNSNQEISLGFAGKIKLTSSVNFIEILPESCYLKVSEEKGDIKYSLNQGVDISSDESLVLNCTTVNSSKVEVSATPSYETYYRGVGDKTVSSIGGDTKAILFKTSEEKMISITLPKAEKPQAYDVKVSLTSNKDISNSVIVHYVLRGLSATIQNVSIDKDSYNKGDTANISFAWSPSADSFVGSRGSAGGTDISGVVGTIDITNKNNNKCIKSISQNLSDKILNLNVQAPIIKDCQNPKIISEIKDAKGNILDHKEYQIDTKSEVVKQSLSLKTIIIILIVIILILIVYLYMKRKNKSKGIKSGTTLDTKNTSSIPLNIVLPFLILIALGSIFSPLKKVEASVSISLDQSAYYPSQTIGVTSSATIDGCANHTRQIIIDGYVSNTPSSGTPYYLSSTQYLFNNNISTFTPTYGYATFSNPSTIGSYDLHYTVSEYVPTTYIATSTFGTDFTSYSSMPQAISMLTSTGQTVASTRTVAGYLYGSTTGSVNFIVMATPVPLSIRVWKNSTSSISNDTSDTINWDTQGGATNCDTCSYSSSTLSGDCKSSVIGKTNGSFTTPHLTSNTTFTISCNDDYSASLSADCYIGFWDNPDPQHPNGGTVIYTGADSLSYTESGIWNDRAAKIIYKTGTTPSAQGAHTVACP